MVINIVNYTKKIGQAVVLDNINVTMEEGKVYGLKGRNGAGKTMLMRAVSGLIRPTEGYVEVDGRKVGKDISFPENMGILLEHPGFIGEYTGYDNLKVLADIRGVVGEKEIREMMERLGLDSYEKKKYKKYSLGMKQKLGIAAAFMENPQLIILDEPVNALYEESIKKFENLMDEARNQKKIIIISCHDSEELYRFSDEILYIDNGKVTKQEMVSYKQGKNSETDSDGGKE